MTLNKTNPGIEYESGMVDGEKYHKYETRVFYAKHKKRLVFRKNQWLAVASKDKIDKKLVKQMFIDRATAKARQGRYHDWAFDVIVDAKGKL